MGKNGGVGPRPADLTGRRLVFAVRTGPRIGANEQEILRVLLFFLLHDMRVGCREYVLAFDSAVVMPIGQITKGGHTREDQHQRGGAPADYAEPAPTAYRRAGQLRTGPGRCQPLFRAAERGDYYGRLLDIRSGFTRPPPKVEIALFAALKVALFPALGTVPPARRPVVVGLVRWRAAAGLVDHDALDPQGDAFGCCGN